MGVVRLRPAWHNPADPPRSANREQQSALRGNRHREKNDVNDDGGRNRGAGGTVVQVSVLPKLTGHLSAVECGVVHDSAPPVICYQSVNNVPKIRDREICARARYICRPVRAGVPADILLSAEGVVSV
jgi:hypothetical protein